MQRDKEGGFAWCYTRASGLGHRVVWWYHPNWHYIIYEWPLRFGFFNISETPAEEPEEEEEDDTLERYDPDPGVIKDWRKDLAVGRKKHKKRKADEMVQARYRFSFISFYSLSLKGYLM